MISYETYKILHIFTLLMVLGTVGAILAEGKWIAKKSFKITVGLLTFLIFVAGMGLIARLGFRHGEPFPQWIWVKMAAWAVFSFSVIMLFRVKQARALFAVLGGLAVLTAVYAAVTKLA